MVGTWVKRSLRYYAARHVVFAGTVALTSAILCAALLTGESLQEGLRRGLRERLGRVRSAAVLGEGVFPASLAERLPEAQAALLLRGELLTAEGEVCAADAQVIGVAGVGAGEWSAARNTRAAGLLAAGEGAVRFEKPVLYSAELPLGAAGEARLVRRAARFGGEAGGGLFMPDFALRAGSVPPVNVFLPHGALAEAAGEPGMANVLVSARPAEELAAALTAALAPEDAGLAFEAAGAETVVKSRRVFLPRGTAEALARRLRGVASASFHLADSFEGPGGATPYGFVAAVTPDGVAVPQDMKDDEVVVNAWLAETLGVKVGDVLTLRWRRFEAGGRLAADVREFRVRGVVPMARAAEAKRLMPSFPGLAGADSCAAWDVGLPMDEEKLKDEANEAYWKQWRETPKAFVTFAAGKACFGTVFGEAMSVRAAAGEAAVRQALAGALTPGQAGFAVRPVWAEGEAVARGSTDFRMLFAGMAMVLVAAALLLAGLSLSLALEARRGEVALFGAVGWGRGRAARMLAAEWGVPLAAGAAAGAAGGAALVWGLGRFWSGAFGGAETAFHFSWPVAGAAAGVSAALVVGVLLGTLRRFIRAGAAAGWRAAGGVGAGGGRAAFGVRGAGGGRAAAAGGVRVAAGGGAAAGGAFFGAGFLLMVSLLLFLRGAGRARPARRQGAAWAGVRRALGAAEGRGGPVAVLLAVGVFLTVGILAMRHDPADGCERPWSGGGGFASIVTSVRALDRERGLELARRVSGAEGVVPVRVREGDEAGCLNMNRPVLPRVVGLDARAMARARAFEPQDAGGVWTQVERPLADGTLPALAADETMLQYSLKARTGAADGTVFEYAAADGTVVRVRVVGALPVRSGILQGALVMDEALFVRAFPEVPGYRMWLCDYAPYALREAADERAFRRGRGAAEPESVRRMRHPEPGVAVETVAERLRLLGSVEATYLEMFLVLGGLGVVLGVAGVALVVRRGLEERRGELALLNAVGVSRRRVAVLLAAEYGALVAAGLLAGVVPAWVAVQPAARSLHGALPWGAMAGVVAGLCGCAVASVLSAAWAAARRYGPEVLKEEV